MFAFTIVTAPSSVTQALEIGSPISRLTVACQKCAYTPPHYLTSNRRFTHPPHPRTSHLRLNIRLTLTLPTRKTGRVDEEEAEEN